MYIYLYQWLVYFGVCIYIQCFYDVLLELIKRRSKVQEKKVSSERALNFDQWKTFLENYKPIRISLWLLYKYTKNNYRSRLFSESIQLKRGILPTLTK